jgi:hypothetical protein
MKYNLVLLLVLSFSLTGCSLTEQNDFFTAFTHKGHNDNNYTQGLILSATSKSEDARKLVSYLPEFPVDRESKKLPDVAIFSFGQMLYTPASKDPEPQIGDRPYAGVLFAEARRKDLYQDSKIETALLSGVIGPWAMGEQIQNGFHDLIDNTHFDGWDNQIDNEPILVFFHRREGEFFRYFDKFQLVGISGIEARLGNLHTDFSPYSEFRYGYNVPRYIEDPKPRFRAYLFGKMLPTLVAYDMTLQGNTYRGNTVTVNPDPAILQMDLGVALEIYHVGIKFTGTYVTREYTSQEDFNHMWGSLSVFTNF